MTGRAWSVPRIAAQALVFLIASGAGAIAQEAPEAPSLWEGEAEFSFVSTTGNASMRTLGTALQLEYRPRGWELVTAGAFVRSRAEGELNAESLTGLFRASRTIMPRLQGYSEMEYLRNRFAGIDHRISPEAGAALRVVAAERQSLRLMGAAGYVREVRIEEDARSFASGNAGLRYRWQVTPTAEFTNEGSFTANLQEGDDWRIGNRASFRVAITSVFSIRLSHTLEHLNDPVPGFDKTDTRMSVALVAGF